MRLSPFADRLQDHLAEKGQAVETVAPIKEISDLIKEKGGASFKFCYQCGICDVVCPWNRVSRFSMRKIVRQATFGLTEIEQEDIWRCTTCGTCPQQAFLRPALP